MDQYLTRGQFNVLYALLWENGPLTQRELSERTQMSVGAVNAAVRECGVLGYVSGRSLTDKGIEALSPYRVDNAIIMAAGLSQRFAPISYERPKGVIRVRGEVLVERQIEQLRAAKVTDITVVVGYKKEYFFYLADKYGVKIAINDEYATRNNNGTLWLVREELRNTYICSSDDYFTVNPFDSHVFQAYYAAQFVSGHTDEWCLNTNCSGRIVDVTVGGEDSWIMLGHAYFDKTFSARFRPLLEDAHRRPETSTMLWESIYVDHIKELDMTIRKYPDGVINEFDSVDEIRGFDPSFIENVDIEVFDNITSVLGCRKSEIEDFYPLKQGITNLSCHFAVADTEYVYRHPGIGTDKIVDRGAEMEALSLARTLGLDNTFVGGDPVKGWKISRFVPGSRNLDVEDADELRRAMGMARELHESGRVLGRRFDFIEEGKKYEALLTEHGPVDVSGYFDLREKVMRLKDYADRDGFAAAPSHNDFFPPNFLVDDRGQISLIDWEYAGMSDIASDFGTLVVCTEMPQDRAEDALSFYFGRTPTPEERRHFWAYVVFAGWCWYVWALLKEAEGDDVGKWLYIYYRHAVDYVDSILTWYELGIELVPESLSRIPSFDRN